MALARFKESDSSPAQTAYSRLCGFIERKRRYEEREFYNADRTRKFTLVSDPTKAPENQYHAVILSIRSTDKLGWVEPMGMLRRVIDGKLEYVLEVETVIHGFSQNIVTSLVRYLPEGILDDVHSYGGTHFIL